MNSKLCIALLLLLVSSTASDFYKKVIHNTDPDAKCLDGSSPMVYLHEGGDTKKILFYFLGGGACFGKDLASTIESCYQRSSGMFGTSKVWPAELEGDGLGILDPRAQQNSFSNWTKILIMYCDGSFHQGNNKNSIKYKNRELFFRGALNTRSHIKWAHQKYNLTQASQIIVSGSSAGGIATYLWVDYVRTLVPNPKTVYGVVDSGIFYNPAVSSGHQERRLFSVLKQKLPSLSEHVVSDPVGELFLAEEPMKILISISNADERTPNKECSQGLSQDQVWKCISIQFSYPTLKFPVLFLQSNYDEYVIKEEMKLNCLSKGASGFTLKSCNSDQMKQIQSYRTIVDTQIMPPLLKNNHSIWAISCAWHAQMYVGSVYNSNLQRVPKETGFTMRKAVEQFVIDNKKVEQMDKEAWPANTPCAY